MNSVLEGYYKWQWKWSKNTKEFLKGFHSEERRQYDIKKRIGDLSESYFSVMDQKKAYSAGNFITGETPLKPTDSQRILYNISRLN